jgi:DNA polymerase III subunit delta
MIKKAFEINKIDFEKEKFFLFYGENEGFKNEIIKNNIELNNKKNIYRYDEKEILDNKENFFSSIYSKSFFENKKIVIISRASDKIKDIIEEIIEKKISDLIIVLNSGILEKKSKLRNLFEKNKSSICVAFYPDNNQTLSAIVNNFFRSKKTPISQESINIIVERSRGDRQNLNNELNKIENFIKNKKKISVNEISKITNLSENYNVSELVDSCLAKNNRRTVKILNENNYSGDDCILIIRTLLNKAKRLKKIHSEIKIKNNLDQAIASFKPPIFWKDKEIVKQQLMNLSHKKTEELIFEINDIELLIKKNSTNAVNIMSNFILYRSNRT